jgi:hypothetical protein
LIGDLRFPTLDVLKVDTDEDGVGERRCGGADKPKCRVDVYNKDNPLPLRASTSSLSPVKRRWLVLIVLTLLVIAGCVLWMSKPEELPGPFVLPDSNRVTLVAATVGPNPSINFGTPIERVLARLPDPIGKRFKRNVVTTDSDASSHLVLWFTYDRPPSNDFFIRAELINNGSEFRSSGFSSGPRNLPNGTSAAYSGMRSWPRREKTLTFRLSAGRAREEYKHKQLGEITISNPAYREYPQWNPEPLPATRRFDNVSFILDDVRDTRRIRLRVTSADKTERAWEAWGCYLRDATGNSLPGHYGFWQREPPSRNRVDMLGEVRLSVMSIGMPEEKAWKLGIRFVRVHHIASNEVFVIRGVPAAATGPRRLPIWSTNLPLGQVQFLYDRDRDARNQPCLTVIQPNSLDTSQSGPQPVCALILGAVSDLGAKIEPIEQTKIHIPAGATNLDVTVAIPRQHLVEYIIDPEPILSKHPPVR